MVSLFDFGILESISWLFPMILIFAVVYAVLVYKNIIQSLTLAAAIAFSVAFIFLLTPGLLEVIRVIVPWYALTLVIMLMLMMVYSFAGVEKYSGQYANYNVSLQDTIRFTMVAVFIIILIAGLAKVYLGSGEFLSQREGTLEAGELSFWSTLLHPSVIGFFVLMVIAFFTVLLLAKKEGID